MIPALCGGPSMEPSAPRLASIFRFGLFQADASRGTLARQGSPVKIQDQPFRVLVMLLQRPGDVITREELRQSLWPEGTYVDFDGSLNVTLKKLRAALDDDSDNPRFIETVPRRGYRFIAPVAVEKVELPAPSNGVELPNPADLGSDAKAPALPETRGAPPRGLVYGASAVVLLVLAGLAWYLRYDFSRTKTSTDPTASAVPVLRESVAVLGLRNLSGKVDDAWLATAFSEMLSTELAAGERLRLVSGEDVANLRQSLSWSQTDTLGQDTAARIGTALNSDLLVLGSYTHVGGAEQGQLRLDVRLQKAKSGEILAEIAETGSSQDLFQITSRVGARLRERLGVPGTAESDEAGVLASLPLDREAAQFYARGLVKLRDFDALAAKDLLEQAAKADPKFSLVHAMLARAWSQLGYEQKRKEEAKKAFDLSIDLPRIGKMQVEGDYYESLGNHEKAASTYGALFELFPDSVEFGLQLVSAQGMAGHSNQAMEAIARLRRLPAPASLDPRIDIAESRVAATKANSLALLESALSKASSQGKKLVYARASLEKCMQLLYGEHPDQAGPACKDGYNIYLAAGNKLGAADALRLMGDKQGAEGQVAQARATYQRALKILEGLGEHLKTATILNNMAIGFTNEGNLDRGEQLYRQAKFHFEQAGDKSNTGVALVNIADILYLRGHLPAAAKTYEQVLEIQASLDKGEPGYALYRLADLNLAEGHVQDAHRLAAQAIDSFRPRKFDLHGAMSEMGDILAAEGDLAGARQQYQGAMDIRQSLGRTGDVAESKASLGELAVEEGHPDQAEPLLRFALAELEKEQAGPDAASVYTVLSRALLMQRKLGEAREAAQRATALSRTSPDPALKLPVAIQNARIEAAGQKGMGHASLASAVQRLRSVIASARKLGYYQIECEARLAMAEAELKIDSAAGRSQLELLEKETHERGLEFLSHKAQLAASSQPSLPGRSLTTPWILP
jgi:DNA-binding winged helix-turn-helix (wHTH) protein/tetratricopeptide (TPR) repeat protein